MTYVVEVPINEGLGSLLVELSPLDTPGELELASDRSNPIGRLSRSIGQSLVPIRALLSTVVETLSDIDDGPDELTVEFSLRLAGEVGFVVVRGNADATILVRASWKGRAPTEKS